MRLLLVFVGCAWSLLWLYSGSTLGVRLTQENAKLKCVFLTTCKSVLCVFKIDMWRPLIIFQPRFKRSVSEIKVSLGSAWIQPWVPLQTQSRQWKNTESRPEVWLLVSAFWLVGSGRQCIHTLHKLYILSFRYWNPCNYFSVKFPLNFSWCNHSTNPTH